MRRAAVVFGSLLSCFFGVGCFHVQRPDPSCRSSAAEAQAARDFEAGRTPTPAHRCDSPERAQAYDDSYRRHFDALVMQRCDPKTAASWGRSDAARLRVRTLEGAFTRCGGREAELQETYRAQWEEALERACVPAHVFALGAEAGARSQPLAEGVEGVGHCAPELHEQLLEQYTRGWEGARADAREERVARAAELRAEALARAAEVAEAAAELQAQLAENQAREREDARREGVDRLAVTPAPTVVDADGERLEVYCRVADGEAEVRAISFSGDSFTISGDWRVVFIDAHGGLIDARTQRQYDYVGRGDAGGFRVSAPSRATGCRAAPLQ